MSLAFISPIVALIVIEVVVNFSLCIVFSDCEYRNKRQNEQNNNKCNGSECACLFATTLKWLLISRKAVAKYPILWHF